MIVNRIRTLLLCLCLLLLGSCGSSSSEVAADNTSDVHVRDDSLFQEWDQVARDAESIRQLESALQSSIEEVAILDPQPHGVVEPVEDENVASDDDDVDDDDDDDDAHYGSRDDDEYHTYDDDEETSSREDMEDTEDIEDVAEVCMSAPESISGVEDEQRHPEVSYDENVSEDVAFEPQLRYQIVCADNVCELRDQICSLSSRICGIASRHPDAADMNWQCTDASSRCTTADSEVVELCGCQTWVPTVIEEDAAPPQERESSTQ